MDKCLVCNSSFVSLRKIKSKKYFYDVCKNCQSGVLRPRNRVIAESQKMYQRNEYFDWGTLPPVKKWLYRIKFYKSYPEWINSEGLKTGRIIDIGAGVTTFVAEMLKDKWDVFAQEISKKQSRMIAKMLKKGQVYNGDFEKMRLPKAFFDVATMWHVLEHIKLPVQTVNQLNRILKKKGQVYIEVPNIDSVNWSIFKDSYNLLDIPVHLFYYSETGLRNLFENNGFRVKEIYQPFKFNSSFSVSLERYLLYIGFGPSWSRLVFYLSLPVAVLINIFACLFKKGEVIRVVAVKL